MTTKRLKRNQGTGKEGAQRAPMPAWIPRPVKRESGRTDPLRTPAHVRLIGVDVDDDEQAYVRRKLGMKLGKFATSIERISVRVTDMNGPRGGVDQLCNVKVVLIGLPSFRTRVELVKVTPTELAPLLRIVAEPFPQSGAGSNFFQPRIELERSFRDPARPQPFHQEARAIASRHRVVRAFQSDHRSLACLVFGGWNSSIPFVTTSIGVVRSNRTKASH